MVLPKIQLRERRRHVVGRDQMRYLMLSLMLLTLTRWDVSAQGSRFAVRFYGTGTGQIDRIKIPLHSAPLLNLGNDFTIEFWMRADYANNAGVVASGQNGDGWITGNVIIDRDVYGPGDYGDFGISIGRSASHSVLAFGLHNGEWGETIVGTNHVGDNIWRHVAVTRQESNGLMRIVVDGKLDAQSTGPTGTVSYRVGRSTSWPDSDPFLVLGAEKHDAGSEYPSFNGGIDELRFWSRALNTNELVHIASRIVPLHDAPGLVAWFRLEEGTNQPIRDSASAYTGTLFSAQTGNGEWTSWAQGSNAAPIQTYQPTLSASSGPSQSLLLRWFAPQNLEYDLEETDSLLPPVFWSAIPGATNLVAADTNMTVTIGTGAAEQRYFRARGTPYR
jgi:hypothetical protein